MSLVKKTAWIIERNLNQPLTLERIAAAADVSPFHLAHVFARATGQGVIAYLRGRKLALAAQALAEGAPDILAVALDAGYGSHEAFTRAVRSTFRTTPETIRSQRTTEGLPMTQPHQAMSPDTAPLAAPKLVDGPAIVAVGLARRQSPARDRMGFAKQWGEFMASHYAGIPHRVDTPPISLSTVVDPAEGEFDYVTAAEVTRADGAPSGLEVRRVPAARYAVFAHEGHVSEIGQTYAAIYDQWFPEHGKTCANGPVVERHRATFDSRTGLGGVDIWIPLAP